MSKPDSIKIDDTEYVRKDVVSGGPDECDGLRYAIVRSRDQGVMSGYVKAIDGRAVTLLKARQLWRWDSKFLLPELAEFGIRKVENCKFSCATSEPVVMLEACGVIYCTATGGASIRDVKATDNG